MASKVFIIHEESGAVLAELDRDGRGRGKFPAEFYDKIGNNPNTQLNFVLKEGFSTEQIITNTEPFRTGNQIDAQQVEININAPIRELRERLRVGRQIYNDFQSQQEDSMTVVSQPKPAQNNLLLLAGALLLL